MQLIINLTLIFFLIFPAYSKSHPKTFTKQPSIQIEDKQAFKFISKKFTKEEIKEIENNFEKIASYLQIPGAAMAIVSKEGVIFKKTYGVKKVGEKEKIDENTKFRIASLSKGFTSFLVAKLAEKKQIKFEDKINKYLPNLIVGNQKHTKKLNINHILSHTTGIIPYAYENICYGNTEFNILTKKLKFAPVTSEPGKRFSYQNFIYNLISPILEKACNKTFNQLMKEEIFEPLNLNNTSIGYLDYEKEENIAFPHAKKRGETEYVFKNPKSNYKNITAAGGIVSSLNDMIKWLQYIMFNDEKLLSIGNYKKIFKPQACANKKIKCKNPKCSSDRCKLYNYKYGLGFYIKEAITDNFNKEPSSATIDAKKYIIFHGGKVNGFSAYIAFCPKNQLGLIIMSNCDSPAMGYINKEFSNKIFDIDKPFDFEKFKNRRQKRLVIEKIIKIIKEEYIYPKVAYKIEKQILKNLKRGKYKEIEENRDLAKILTQDLQKISKDLHLKIRLNTPKQNKQSNKEQKNEDYGFKQACMIKDKIGYMKLNAFKKLTPESKSKAIEMFKKVENAKALIFDLRDNTGGSHKMIEFISSYLFIEPTLLNIFFDKKGKEKYKTITYKKCPGKRFAKDCPVFVLTSNKTFSAAEEFAYNLQSLKRGIIIGEISGGGAHPGCWKKLNKNLKIFISTDRSYNPITKTNWEGRGVIPDVIAPQEEALIVAIEKALKKISKTKYQKNYDSIKLNINLIPQLDDYSCATTSLAMAISYFEKKAIDKNKIWKISGSSISDVKNYGNDMNGLKKVADHYGYVSEFREKMSINDIEQYLSNGIPVIINILQPQKIGATHAVLIIGYDRNKKILLINDPAISVIGKSISYKKLNELWSAYIKKPDKTIYEMVHKSGFIIYPKN